MEVKSREEFEKLKKLVFFKGVVVTDSMEPLLKVGEKIIVDVGSSGLARFDIIVFWNEKTKELTCHYLWAINRIITPVLYQTRNFNFGGFDFPISEEFLLGKVVSQRLSVWHKLRILFRDLFRRAIRG